MNRMIWLLCILVSTPLMADPLDRGEAYTIRSAPPKWMDNMDLGLLMVDYAIFALTLVALGWLLYKKPAYLLRLESLVHVPFAVIFAAANGAGAVGKFVLQTVGGLAILVALAAWVFFCQWLKHIGLGAFAMVGLGLLALFLVRIIKGNEKQIPTP